MDDSRGGNAEDGSVPGSSQRFSVFTQEFLRGGSEHHRGRFTDQCRYIFRGFLALEEDSSVPQILIYHTHSQEGFADSTEGDEATSVIGVGDYLTSILQDVYGYQVIHRKDAFDLMEGQLDRSKAYNYALPVIEQVLAENPTIQVVIDLHRDGVPEGKHLVTEINGKPTAQIMYFNGLSRTVKTAIWIPCQTPISRIIFLFLSAVLSGGAVLSAADTVHLSERLPIQSSCTAAFDPAGSGRADEYGGRGDERDGTLQCDSG